MSDLYVAKSKISGKGIFTKHDIKKGQKIDVIHGPIVVFRRLTPQISKKMLNWIGVGRYSWIDTTNSKYKQINHSCDPSTAIVGKRTIIAIKNIPAGGEITMDYSLTEAEPGWGIQCTCGAKTCRKEIGPVYELPKALIRKHQDHMTKNFLKIYEVENGPLFTQ